MPTSACGNNILSLPKYLSKWRSVIHTSFHLYHRCISVHPRNEAEVLTFHRDVISSRKILKRYNFFLFLGLYTTTIFNPTPSLFNWTFKNKLKWSIKHRNNRENWNKNRSATQTLSSGTAVVSPIKTRWEKWSALLHQSVTYKQKCGYKPAKPSCF